MLTEWGTLVRLSLRQSAKFNEKLVVRVGKDTNKPYNPFYTVGELLEGKAQIFNDREVKLISYNDISAIYKLWAEKPEDPGTGGVCDK